MGILQSFVNPWLSETGVLDTDVLGSGVLDGNVLDNVILEAKKLDRWTLRIYSPELSHKFVTALYTGNIIEQRRITYYALYHKFVDKNNNENNWASNNSSNLLNRKNNYAGFLNKDPTVFEGLTIYLYGYFDAKNNFTEEITEKIDISDKFLFAYNTKHGPIDKYFPIDINLQSIEEDMNSSNFYNEYDFQGWFGDASLFGSGTGILSGRLRGFGHLDFYMKLEGLSSHAGLSYGVVTGSYIGDDANPSNPFGALYYFLGESRVNPNTGEWWSEDEHKNVVWKGDSPSIGVNFGFGNDNLGNTATSITNISRI